ncbi:hypothetical protein C4578_00165 [Candidatus Microgenomates bacterium]|jgi:hypothetical protein|nr:MAG: hypothetical protein C4578_00165 [Candidatus Microgenomates bacterium]
MFRKAKKTLMTLVGLFFFFTQTATTAFAGCQDNEVRTALGCIPVGSEVGSLNEFVGWIIGRAIFVGSGIAFLLMVLGSFQILTSAGNPEKARAGKEVLTSAVSGLLFIIFSIFLLRLVGVDILHIPGLGAN